MHNLIGMWRLIKGRAFDKTGAELPPPLGPEPVGIAQFGPDRMIAVVGDGRRVLPTDAPRLLIAYSGTYSCDGNQFATKVDASSDPTLIGTEQRRDVEFEDRLMIVRPASEVLPSLSEHMEFVWERVSGGAVQ